MLTRLPESNAQRQRRAGGLAVSTALHLLIIGLAVHASGWTAPAPAIVTPLPPLTYVEPRSTVPPTQMRNSTKRTSATGDQPLPRLSRPTIGLPDEISAEIPPPGAMANLIRSEDFRAHGIGLTDDDIPGTTPNAGNGAPLTERFVDRAVIAIPGTATPRYPSALQNAGVDGDVRAQFVVDTLGRVEPGSVRILDSTHDLFARAVRDALARARFTPAEAGGRKVRQLAEQAFTFRIGLRD